MVGIGDLPFGGGEVGRRGERGDGVGDLWPLPRFFGAVVGGRGGVATSAALLLDRVDRDIVSSLLENLKFGESLESLK